MANDVADGFAAKPVGLGGFRHGAEGGDAGPREAKLADDPGYREARGRFDFTPDHAAKTGGGVASGVDGGGHVNGKSDFPNKENVVEDVICFTPGTLIATPRGERRIEDLAAGDRVITRDNGIQEIAWIGRRDLGKPVLDKAAHLRPVLIRAGALGNGLPERDMMISPNHRVLVANDKTTLYFEEREVLVAAKHLTGLEGVDVVTPLGVSYIHMMFAQHEVILSDGSWTESFQPGDTSLAGIGNAQRTEIFELFPELDTPEGLAAYQAARRALRRHEAKVILD